MDFIESAKILVPALCGLNLSVFCDDDKTQPLRLFEKQYAFSAKLQPSFTEKGLLSLFEKKGAENILVIRDALDIFAVMIKINKRWILLGPFCTANWNESNAISLLAKNGLGNAELLPYKSYRCGLPVMSEEYIIKIAALLITNTVGNPPRELEIINMAALKLDDLPPQISEAYNDFSQVNRRYAWENDLMDAVRQGQTARALNLLEGNKGLWTGIRFLTDSITDQIAGSCTLRALVRHAAQQAGLTPVFIDALSQEYAQKMHRHTTDAQQLNDLLHQYIAAFCRAVRDNKKKTIQSMSSARFSILSFTLVSLSLWIHYANLMASHANGLEHYSKRKSVRPLSNISCSAGVNAPQDYYRTAASRYKRSVAMLDMRTAYTLPAYLSL